ncbi:hypothetical protein [Streptomyces aureocirculatus]|uniref:hypothetical protein n=1 Tax=Streptomyces aureocirculatus TaxID=67275 RepID=UPI0006916B99|nr:hypothetical protein [Streptomyces aureocirculatus]
MGVWSLPRTHLRKRVLVVAAAAGAAGAVLGPAQAAQADILGIGNQQNGNTAVVHGANQTTNTTTTGSGVLTGPVATLPVNTTQAAAGNSGITCVGAAHGPGGLGFGVSDRALKTAVTAVVWER